MPYSAWPLRAILHRWYCQSLGGDASALPHGIERHFRQHNQTLQSSKPASFCLRLARVEGARVSKHYSPKTFFRQVRRKMLLNYFSSRSISLAPNFEHVKRVDVDALYQRIAELPPVQREQIDEDLAAIGGLASPGGTAAMLHEAQVRGISEVATIFQMAGNHHERALWTFMYHPELFARARECFHMDQVAASRWRRRFVGTNLQVNASADCIAALQRMIQECYSRQGRGRQCHVDHYTRDRPFRHCYFAYPEDHSCADLGYGKDNQLRRHPRRPAFEVIFVYRPEDGLLEVMAPGGGEAVEDLSAAFCTTVLGLPALPPLLDRPAFTLDVLMDRSFAFPVEPHDGIEDVYLQELQFCLPGNTRPRLVLSARVSGRNPQAIHHTIDEFLQPHFVRRQDVKLGAAKMRMDFRRPDARRPKPLTFRISTPDICTLKDDPHDQIAKRCLVRWGIAADTIVPSVPFQPGQQLSGRLRAG